MLPPDDQARRIAAIEAHFERRRPTLPPEPELLAKGRRQLKAFIEDSEEGAIMLRRILHPSRPGPDMTQTEYAMHLTARIGAWHEVLALITQEEAQP